VYHDGEQVVVAHGTANLATGAPMTEDTGYLVGSITKVLTTALLLRYAERGLVDLDERVVTYLPEFALAPPAQAGEIRVRQLVNHTNGIDADMLLPDFDGPDALTRYVEALGRCGTLFDPGEYVTYSNPGFSVAGRILEVLAGTHFDDLLERELFAAVGMADSCTSAGRAILRRTAVGHFRVPETQAMRRTGMFMLSGSISAAGSTPIVTIADLLAFARTDLAGGVTPSGERLLAAESVERMRTVTHDMGTPNVPPIGLGWWAAPFGATVGLTHGGASPGGTAHLISFPEHDLAFAAFGNGPGARVLHDRLTLWLLREHLALEVPDVVTGTVNGADLAAYEGTYRAHQVRTDVRAIDGRLEQAATFEPMDDDHARTLREFSGGTVTPPPQRLVPVGERLFADAEQPLDAFTGMYGRMSLVSFHGAYRSSMLRLARREENG
jgi:CubicO group peptidase (beta-lactamase class C family)